MLETGRLGPAQPNNQCNHSTCDQDDSYSGRQFFAVLGLDAELGITNLHAMFLLMRNRDDKGEQAKNQQQSAYYL